MSSTLPPTQQHTYNINTLLKIRAHTISHITNTPNSQNTSNIKIYTIKHNHTLISRYNNIINNTRHNKRDKKRTRFKIPTFNSKFSLRGSSLAESSATQPGHWSRRPPPELGADLVALGGLHQENPAPSSEATVQQQSPSLHQTQDNTTNKNEYNKKKAQKHKRYKVFLEKKSKAHNHNNTQSEHATHNNNNTQAGTQPHTTKPQS
jgi:hypothetical protein